MGFLLDNSIKAVCFDIDGTFYPQWRTKFNIARASIFYLPFAVSYNKARQRVRTEDSFLDLPIVTKEERAKRMCQYMWQREDDSSIQYFIEKEERVFFKKYEKLFSNLKSFDGVRETLDQLKKEGYLLGVLSDFPVGSKLKAMGIEDYFTVIVSSEDMGRYKPCLTPFKVLAEKIGVEPSSILYVGDSVKKDILGAKSSGFKTALICSKKECDDADITASSWYELKESLF